MQIQKIRNLVKPHQDDEAFVEFQLKIEKNKISAEVSEVEVILCIGILGDEKLNNINMQSKGQSEAGLIYYQKLKILKNQVYVYKYRVNNEYEIKLRNYKYDINLQNGVDEWNKIWIGYHFNHKKHIHKQQENQQSSNSQLFKDYKLMENIEQFFPYSYIKENTHQKVKLCSNYLIFEFCDDLIFNLLKFLVIIGTIHQYQRINLQYTNELKSILEELKININNKSNEKDSVLENHKQKMKKFDNILPVLQYNNQEISEQMFHLQTNQIFSSEFNNSIEQQMKEMEFQKQKFKNHQQIYQNYTNNLHRILEELLSDTNYMFDEKIQNLLTPIEIPQIDDPIFDKCKQNLIIINNKLEDLKQNKSKIQEQYDALKRNYDRAIQDLSDYEKLSEKKNDKNQKLIKKLKQELKEKSKEIENLKKEQKDTQIQKRIRIMEAKQKYHEDIQKLEQKLIDQIERQRNQTIKLSQDTNKRVQLLEIEKAKNLIREKDTIIKNQSEFVTTLLQQIQNYKELFKNKIQNRFYQ